MSKIFVVLRYDDFSAISDINIEKEIIDFFNKESIGLTIGVVPFIKKGNLFNEKPGDLLSLAEPKRLFLKEILQKGHYEIALHGYSHIPIKDYFRYSEFERIPLGKQIDLIKRGKDHLESLLSIKIETFIPPFNSYDRNTIRALKSLHFKIISAALWGYIPFRGIDMIPATCTLDNFNYALDMAKKFIKFNPIIVNLFHPFELVDENKKLDRIKLEKFKELIQSCLTEKDVEIITVSKLSRLLKNRLSGNRFFFNKILEKLTRSNDKIEKGLYSKVYWGISGALYFTAKSILNL